MSERILFFRRYVLAEGGEERLMFELADQFSKKNLDFRLAMFQSKPLSEIFNGKYRNIEFKNLSKPIYGKSFFKDIKFFLIGIINLRRFIKEYRPTIILGQSSADAQVLYLATFGIAIPYANFIHDSFFTSPTDRMKYFSPFKKKINSLFHSDPSYAVYMSLNIPTMKFGQKIFNRFKAIFEYIGVRKSKCIMVLSERVAREVSSLYKKSSTVIKCGIDSRMLDYKSTRNPFAALGISDGLIVLEISRLALMKRIDLAVRAFSKIDFKKYDAHFVIGGTGPEQEKLKTLIKKINMTDRIILAGFISEKDIYDYYANADIILHPACIDFDITVMEGLAFQKKVIVTSEYDISGNLKGLENNFLFQSEPDENHIAETIIKAFDKISEMEIKEEKKLLEEYTWENYAEKIYSELHHAIEY